MAYTPTTGSYSYGDKSIREDLWDSIKDLDPIENYVTSHAESVPVTNKIHSWVTDPITNTSSQAGTLELSDTVFAAANPSLLFNTTQIIEKGIAVSGTDQNSKHAGFADKFAREQLKKMKEWKNQLEYSVVAGTLVSGLGSTTARTMAGIGTFASTLASTLTSATSLTSAILDNWLGNAWDLVGADHDTMLVGKNIKNRISSFTQGNTKNVSAKDYETVGRVDVYDSDNGRLEVVKHRYVNSASSLVYGTAIITYMKDYIKVGFLDKPHFEDRAKTGYYKAGAIVGEATCQVSDEGAVSLLQGSL